MNIYEKLNDLQIDTNEHTEQLSHFEQKKWAKRVKRNLGRSKKKSGKMLMISAAAVLVMSASIYLTVPLVADEQYSGGSIESFVSQVQPGDYTDYKKVVDLKQETTSGTLTLHELMIDGDRLFISSLLEPANDFDFSYDKQLEPEVVINGVTSANEFMAQSIDEAGNAFTIYNEVDLAEIPAEEELEISISYHSVLGMEKIELPEPWTFELTVPTEEMTAPSSQIEMNEVITLPEGHTMTVTNTVITPVSVQFDMELSDPEAEKVSFELVSPGGEKTIYGSSLMDSLNKGESYIRFYNYHIEPGTRLVPVHYETLEPLGEGIEVPVINP
ncbi:DUF4179 domain-containing protein [Jeotgalibacillus terrae]|uniref:DUF4179 domain-containing protein n=1 Tax=Jeotgalibacillus terrae TaxID=587735 RepID=A0ABW5ZIQ8_9BACL|nr:DUF4179 domain-containing protein [Jeotgalibacillus terrae]MBM7580330.1 hypothetical protein [Jeotgalibacillus terrae]